ncbi:hypothetical protein D3C78_1517460 [compost metagenome]
MVQLAQVLRHHPSGDIQLECLPYRPSVAGHFLVQAAQVYSKIAAQVRKRDLGPVLVEGRLAAPKHAGQPILRRTGKQGENLSLASLQERPQSGGEALKLLAATQVLHLIDDQQRLALTEPPEALE